MCLAKDLHAKGEHVGYVNLEDQRVLGQDDPWDRLLSWFGEEEGYLLLDEITSVPGWSSFLARCHELYKENLHLVVTSSQSGLSSPPKELRGRIMPVEVFPLSFKESLRFQNIQVDATSIGRSRAESALESYLHWGGLPQVVLEKDETEKASILSLVYRNTIAIDVAESARFDNTEIELIGRYLIQTPYFSAGRCLAYLNSVGFRTSKEKLLILENLLQASYLFHFPHIFSYGVKDRAQYPRKCFAGDNGFFSIATTEVGAGRRWENSVLLSMCSHLGPGKDICYWKDRQGREVDVVLRSGTKVDQVVQVCSSLAVDRTRRREIDALVRCASELKAERSILVCNEEWTKEIDGIAVEAIPLVDWLLQRSVARS